MRLVIVSLVLAAIGLPVLVLWHSFQVGRNASALLSRAGDLEDEQSWSEAALSLHRYLQLRPDDHRARIRLAQAFDASAETLPQKTRAAQLYAAAIGVAPGERQLAERHMTLLFELGDHTGALQHSEKLLQKEPDNPAALRINALSQYDRLRDNRKQSWVELAAAFVKAIEKNPGDLVLHQRLARLYRIRLQQPAEADKTMQRLVETAENKTEALLARYEYRKEFKLAEADGDLDQALALDVEEKHFPTRMHAAQRAVENRDWDSAAAYFEQAIRAEASDARGYLGLAQCHAAQNDDRAAIEACERGLSAVKADDPNLLYQLSSAQVRQSDYAAAESNLDRIEKILGPLAGPDQSERLALLTVQRADIAMRKRTFSEAITLLKQSQLAAEAGAETPKKLALKIDILFKLGQCYSSIEQWDQAALVFHQATLLQPKSVQAKLFAARAWEMASRLKESIHEYEAAIEQQETAGAGDRSALSAMYVSYAQVLYRQQITATPQERNWEQFQQVLTKAQAAAPESASLDLLSAEYEATRGRTEVAYQLFQAVEDAVLKDPTLVGRLMVDYERLKHPADADRLLERLRADESTRDQAIVLSADLSSLRDRHDEAAAQLRMALSGMPEAKRGSLALRLALLHLAHGKQKEARAELEKLAAGPTPDVRVLQLLAEMALNAGELQPAEFWEAKLREREGSGGSTWRFYRAQRLMNLAKASKAPDKGDALLAEARSLQADLERLRPNWAPAFILKARLNQQSTRPNAEAAIQAYRRALALGERNIAVYQELISLLYQQNLLAEAADYLARLRASARLTPELKALGMAVDAGRGNVQEAIQAAREELKREPNNPMHSIRLGQLLTLEVDENSRTESDEAGAETLLLRARELAADDLRTWSALFSFYTRAPRKSEADDNRVGKAKKLLEELESNKNIAQPERAFFLAQGYALVGDREAAARFYDEALAANPDHAPVYMRAAVFYFKEDPAKAQQCFENALRILPENNPTHGEARRMLAMLLAGQAEGEKDLQKVWQLLKGTEEDAVDERMQAMLLIQRGGSDYRAKAQQILESLVANPKDSAPVDRLLLARLYEAQGKAREAREQLEVLIQRDNPLPDHLAVYVDHLLRSGRVDDAARQLDKLAQVEPESSSLRTLQLRLRVLKEQKQEDQIPELVEKHVQASLAKHEGTAEKAQFLANIAKVLSDLELNSAAETYHRQAWEANPAHYTELCIWLSERSRASEAFDICMAEIAKDRTPMAAMTLAQVLTLGKVSTEQRRTAEPLLQIALKQHGNQFALLFSIATLKHMEGNNDEAAKLLEQAHELTPRNLVVLNNLALVLAMIPQRLPDALKYIDRAIDLAGQSPELLDSKGWILLQQNEFEKATVLFQEAVMVPPGDPRYHFHLAIALQAQGKQQEAREALARARQLKLSEEELTPQERSALATLQQAIQ